MNEAAALLVGLLIATMVLAPLSCSAGKSMIQSQAVERGHAAWIPDKFGKTAFQWKEAK